MVSGEGRSNGYGSTHAGRGVVRPPHEGTRRCLDGVSIVIPSKGRTPLLASLLDSINATVDEVDVPVEVIVVDDTASQHIQAQRMTCESRGARYIRGPARVGIKRNIGAFAACYEIILFIDSDCRLISGSLRGHLDAHRQRSPEVAAIAGPTVMDQSGGDGVAWNVMKRSSEFNVAFEFPILYSQLLWATTSNLSVRRDAFVQVGGFSGSTLTVVGGEDVDLGVRLCHAGYRIESEPKAAVAHSREPIRSLRDVVRRLYTYGRSAAWVCAVHPSHRRWHRNPFTMAVSAGVVTSVFTARRRVPDRMSRVMLSAGLAAVSVFAAEFARTTLDRREPGDKALDTAASAVSVVVDWSFDLGEVVGAIQLGRPQNIFRRFGFVDDEYFVEAKPEV